MCIVEALTCSGSIRWARSAGDAVSPPSSARPASASCMAESCSLVFTRLPISPGQMFVGLMNAD